MFLAKNKARTVFVDLTAAYDFVCYRGLSCKLLRLLPDRNIFRMMMELISIRSFTLTTGRMGVGPPHLFLGGPAPHFFA